MADQIFADTGLTDIDAQLQQFPVQAGRSPKDVTGTHVADQSADLFRCHGTSNKSIAAPPIPVEAESSSMPSDNRLRLDQDDGLAPLGPEAMKGNPKEPVRGPKRDSSSLGSLENGQLVAEGQNFNLQRGPCSKRGEQPGEQRCQDSAHEPGR